MVNDFFLSGTPNSAGSTTSNPTDNKTFVIGDNQASTLGSNTIYWTKSVWNQANEWRVFYQKGPTTFYEFNPETNTTSLIGDSVKGSIIMPFQTPNHIGRIFYDDYRGEVVMTDIDGSYPVNVPVNFESDALSFWYMASWDGVNKYGSSFSVGVAFIANNHINISANWNGSIKTTTLDLSAMNLTYGFYNNLKIRIYPMDKPNFLIDSFIILSSKVGTKQYILKIFINNPAAEINAWVDGLYEFDLTDLNSVQCFSTGWEDYIIGVNASGQIVRVTEPVKIQNLGRTYVQNIDNLRYNLNADYIQLEDVLFDNINTYDPDDVNATNKQTAWTTGTGWVAIGRSAYNKDFEVSPFTGHYNGNGFTVYNMYCDQTNYGTIALFAQTSSTAVIAGLRVKLQQQTFFGGDNCAGIVVTNLGTITGCCFVGTIQTDGSNIGGICSDNRGLIERSYCEGQIAQISTGSGSIGGLVGSNYGGDITNCYAVCHIGSEADGIGGLIGNNLTDYDINRDPIPSNITNCYAAGIIFSPTGGGLIGTNAAENVITSCYYDTTVSNKTDNDGRGIPKTTEEMKQQATFVGWDFTTIPIWLIGEGSTYPVFELNI